MVFLFIACSSGGGNDNTENADKSMGDTTNTIMKQSATDRKYILFFGNSLTAGYGLDEDQSYPALIQDRIDSLGLPYQVINGGLSGSYNFV